MCKVYMLYKCANRLYRFGVPVLPTLFFYFARIVFGAHVPYKAQIGPGTVFGFGALGVVLHPDTVIGSNCNIAQNVTIGGRAPWREVPILGNNVFVGAGAAILGPVKIGDNVCVGANAVVIHDVPASAIVAGVPARIVRKEFSACA